ENAASLHGAGGIAAVDQEREQGDDLEPVGPLLSSLLQLLEQARDFGVIPLGNPRADHLELADRILNLLDDVGGIRRARAARWNPARERALGRVGSDPVSELVFAAEGAAPAVRADRERECAPVGVAPASG